MDKLKTILSKIKLPKLKMPYLKLPKISFTKPKIGFDKVKIAVVKIWPILNKSFKLFLKTLKVFMSWFGKAVKESIAQVWTLLGFFIAWLTLTGTAQQIVGIATLAATAIWLLTIPLREEKE